MTNLNTPQLRLKFTKAPEDGLLAALLLAFLSTAGLFYVNLGGAFLSAFVDGLGLSLEAAGKITAANKYGAAFGALLAVFSTGRLAWRKVAYVVLISLILIDLTSMHISDPQVLMSVRFLHGTFGGFLVGTGFSVIAQTKSPDRVFGVLLVVQYSFGSIGILCVPRLVAMYGYGAVFSTLIAFSLITLVLVPFIANYKSPVASTSFAVKPISWTSALPFCCALSAIFAFQAANMGTADYIFELGKSAGLDLKQMSFLVSTANWIAITGAVLVYMLGVRFGRAIPLVIGLLLSISGTFAFHWSDSPWVFFLANAVTGVAWAFLIPYLLGLCAAFDQLGRSAALAGFVSKMGLASGPMIAASVVGDGNFDLIINLASGGLVLCMFVAFFPARLLDSKKTVEST